MNEPQIPTDPRAGLDMGQRCAFAAITLKTG